MAISAVGTITPVDAAAANTWTQSTTAVGNCVVVGTRINSPTLTVTSITGGGCTWVSLGSPYVSVNRGRTYELWLGTVTSVVTNATVTVAWSASIATKTPSYDPQEFTNGVTSTWALEAGQYAGVENNTNANPLAFPSLVSSAANRLYFGRGSVGSSTPSTSGTPTSFTFFSGDMWCYGVVDAGTIAPTQTTTSSTVSGAAAALIVATATGASAGSSITSTATPTANVTSPAGALRVTTALVLATASVAGRATQTTTVSATSTASAVSAPAATPTITASVFAFASTTGRALPVITASATATATRIDPGATPTITATATATARRVDPAAATVVTTASVVTDIAIARPTDTTRLNVHWTGQPTVNLSVDIDELVRLSKLGILG